MPSRDRTHQRQCTRRGHAAVRGLGPVDDAGHPTRAGWLRGRGNPPLCSGMGIEQNTLKNNDETVSLRGRNRMG